MPTYQVIKRVIHDTSGLYSQGDISDRPCPAITIGVNGLNASHYQVEYYLTDELLMTKRKDIGGARRLHISGDEPAPAVMAGGIGSVNTSQYTVADQAAPDPQPDKPAYSVPSMAEIAAVPWNGFNAISTFSGCGGSSLGYKMAGFKVLWASEFIPAAQETYRANHPDTILDTRDIRQVQPQDILDATGLGVGDLDLLDGSPPCASFSTAGKREAGWGKVKAYSDTKQRTDDLFFEYVRLLNGLQPKVFVAENVSGLVKGTAKGYFLEILAAMKACGYRVTAKVLDAQWLGVPQMRQRVIFVGVRNDLNAQPAHPKPLPYRYSVRDAIPWIISQGDNGGFGEGSMRPADQPSPTIGQGVQSGNGKFPPSIVEAETDISGYAIGREWDQMGNEGTKSDKYLQLVRPALDKPCNTITSPLNGQFSKTAFQGSASVVHPTEKRKFSIAELKRICAFPDDFILTGTYAQQWERLGRAVPPIMMYRIAKTIRDEILAKCAE